MTSDSNLWCQYPIAHLCWEFVSYHGVPCNPYDKHLALRYYRGRCYSVPFVPHMGVYSPILTHDNLCKLTPVKQVVVATIVILSRKCSACIYLLLLILMLWHRQAIIKSKGDKLSSSAECRIRTHGLGHQFASRLNTYGFRQIRIRSSWCFYFVGALLLCDNLQTETWKAFTGWILFSSHIQQQIVLVLIMI